VLGGKYEIQFPKVGERCRSPRSFWHEPVGGSVRMRQVQTSGPGTLGGSGSAVNDGAPPGVREMCLTFY